jgi:plastocyanin
MLKARYIKSILGLGLGLVLGGPALAAETVEITIREYKYDPVELRIKSGTTVKWTNLEKRASHSILFIGAGGFESERIFPGETWQRTFDTPGEYRYTCGPHPEMRGRIDVIE